MRQKDQITLIIATLWTPLRHPGWESLFHSIIRSKQFNNKNQTTFIILTLHTALPQGQFQFGLDFLSPLFYYFCIVIS